MAPSKQIGRIASVKLGSGGYQDACFGFSFELAMPNAACGDFFGYWRTRPNGAEWTPEDRTAGFGDAMKRVADLMHDAKVDDFSKLAGKPIEITFDGLRMQSWRILTEVL